MVAVPLLSGVRGTERGEFSVSYPMNLEPVVVDSKISKGQLRAASGSTLLTTGPGIDRGGITWNEQNYRVMGTRLVRVERGGTVAELGDVGGTGQCGFDYSFDRLGVRSGTSLFYWDGASLTEVTDVDLGQVVDHIWIDGYWMTTDGTSIVVTELADPTSVDPLKYGSAEQDPDMVTGLLKHQEEALVFGRFTIQFFRNVGGNGFPFQFLKGATIPYGCISATAKCLFADSFAFVGSRRDEALRVYVGGQGSATPISTRTVDEAIGAVEDPTSIILENRTYRGERRLIMHLPTESWAFLEAASRLVGEPVWYRLQSGGGQPYRLRNAVAAYNGLIVGDLATGMLGWLSDDVSTHFDESTEWAFDAGLIYNEGRGGIVHAAELIGLTGRGPAGEKATAFMSLTRDSQNYSIERAASMGKSGETQKRLQWRPHAKFDSYLGFRFRGFNTATPGFARLEVEIEPLNA